MSGDDARPVPAHAWRGPCGCDVCTGVPPGFPPGSVIFPDYALRGRDGAWWQALTHEQRRMVCPPDVFGQSESARCGPCRKCL